MRTRAWLDFPLLLNDNRIAKVVFQKSADGQTMLDKAFDVWNAPASGSSVPADRAIVVSLESVGGAFMVPVTINGQLTLKFVIDSGASDVSIPADVVSTLVRTETITDADFIGQQSYQMADGSTVPSERFLIRSLKVGDTTLTNVTAAIAPVKAGLLLGQSFLGRFKSWSIDNQRRVLMLQ
jgi:clan AA aspartic protease (TIGR02281 family)